MREETKLNNLGKYIFLGMIMIMGIAFLVVGARDVIGIGKAVDFNEIAWDDVEKDMYVKSGTNMVLDYYCEEVKTRNGVETGRNRWYLVPYSSDQENWHFIGVKVDKGSIEKYETVVEDTEDWLEGEVAILSYDLKITGRVRECKGEVKDYLNDYISEWEEYNGSDSANMFVPYYIDLTSTKGSTTMMVVGGIAVVVCAGLFVFFIVKSKKESQRIEGKVDFSAYTASGSSARPSGGYTDKEGFYTNGGDELDRILAEEERKRQDEEDRKNDPYYM